MTLDTNTSIAHDFQEEEPHIKRIYQSTVRLASLLAMLQTQLDIIQTFLEEAETDSAALGLCRDAAQNLRDYAEMMVCNLTTIQQGNEDEH